MRAIHELDPTLPLSEAVAACLLTPASGASGQPSDAAASGVMRDRFQLGRTLLVVPGGRLARAVERRLLERSRAAKVVLEAPSIVTPLMLFGRFVVPTRPMLSAIGAQASWREAIERVVANDPALAARLASAFGSPVDLPARLRPRVSARLARLSAEVASAMQSFTSVREAIERLASRGLADNRLVEHWRTLERVARVRADILDAANVADRDEALRDALLAERSTTSQAHATPSSTPAASLASQIGGANQFDRVVILFADPEPVHRALFRALEARGLSIELCVHAVREWTPAGAANPRSNPEPVIDDEGFPLRSHWVNREFGADLIAHDTIRVGEGPRDAAGEVVAAIGSIPEPRRSDQLAVMAPDDDTRRAIEAALGEAGSSAARVESRVFSSTRLGTLLARVEALLGEESMDAFAAYIRHPDVSRALSGTGEERDVARYRVETIADSWRDGISAAGGAAGFRAMRDRVLVQVAPIEGERKIAEWARPIRAYLQSIVGEDASGGFVDERARSIAALDRVLGEFADVPPQFSTPIRCAEAIRLLRAAVDRTEIRGDRREAGVSIVRWLDAGIADEPHLVLAGFADGAVPEGDVTDVLIPDPIRRTLGLLSSERRSARDAWILDGMLRRMHARRGAGLPASVQFVVARRSASGDPLRPSRFLLRIESTALAARVARLFPAEREIEPVVSATVRSVEFPVRPKVEGSVFTSISVTAFSTYLKCPYLFQLQRDPRLRLESSDERATELDARRFGNLLHESVERWGLDEKERAQPTTDRATIERSVLSHLGAAVARELPASPSSAVRVQLEILRARLRRFAEMQAREAEAGWHVRFVELEYDEKTGPMLRAAGADDDDSTRGLRLVGRIDRVDRNEQTGAWRALDYKSGSAGDAPAATHLKGRAGKRSWKDLQLPLYRHLLAEGRLEGMQPIPVESSGLGYINLAASAERSGFRMLECTAAEFDMAFDEARRVVDGVLRGEFAPAGRTPFPPDDPLAAVWGLGLRAQALGLEAVDAASDADASDAAASAGGDA